MENESYYSENALILIFDLFIFNNPSEIFLMVNL